MFVRAGVTKIRLTGGEPTVRRDLPEVVAALSALRPLGLEEISMTTNGIALKRMLPALQAALVRVRAMVRVRVRVGIGAKDGRTPYP